MHYVTLFNTQNTVRMQEIAECTRSYFENKCHPDERIPAIEKLCTEWHLCMNRDPQEVAG